MKVQSQSIVEVSQDLLKAVQNLYTVEVVHNPLFLVVLWVLQQVVEVHQALLLEVLVQDLSGVGVHAQDLEVEVDLLHLVAAEVGQSLLQGVNQDPQPEVDQAHKEVDQDHQEVDQDLQEASRDQGQEVEADLDHQLEAKVDQGQEVGQLRLEEVDVLHQHLGQIVKMKERQRKKKVSNILFKEFVQFLNNNKIN